MPGLTKIEPSGLTFEPGIHNVLDHDEFLLPLFDILFKGFNEG